MPHDGVEAARVERATIALAGAERDPHSGLCVAAARMVGVTGAGVVLISHGSIIGSVCCSDECIAEIEEMQYTLGEGPCIDACHTGVPILVEDLSQPDLVRWVAFRGPAMSRGIFAVFGFPLLIGGICIGALNLFHAAAGALTDDQYRDALALARVTGRIVMNWQTEAGGQALPWQLEQVPAHRAVVHQAAGMVSRQAAVTIDDAMVLLRAYAFAEDETIGAVSHAVVDRELRFDGDASAHVQGP